MFKGWGDVLYRLAPRRFVFFGNRVQRYNRMEVRCGLKSVCVGKYPIKHEKVGQSGGKYKQPLLNNKLSSGHPW